MINNNYNWFNNPNYLNSVYYELSYNFNLTEKIKLFYALNDVITINLKELFDIEYIQKYKEYLKRLTFDVVNIKFPLYDILKEELIIELEINDELKEYIPNEIHLTNDDLINRLNYKTNYLFDVINTYDKYISNHANKREILTNVFKMTHKSMIYNDKMTHWIDNFPNMIDNKIRAIKNKKKNLSKSNKAKIRYKTSTLRLKNIIRKMNSLGYYDFDEREIKPKMKLLEDDEIIQDLINEFSEVNQDHDMIIYDDSKILKDPLKDYYIQKEEDDYYEYLQFNEEILTKSELNDFNKLKTKYGGN